MRITIRPRAEPQREIDITTRLIAVIAEELHHLYGGNDLLNWLEAEQQLEAILSGRLVDAQRRIAETREAEEPAQESSERVAESAQSVCGAGSAAPADRVYRRDHRFLGRESLRQAAREAAAKSAPCRSGAERPYGGFTQSDPQDRGHARQRVSRASPRSDTDD